MDDIYIVDDKVCHITALLYNLPAHFDGPSMGQTLDSVNNVHLHRFSRGELSFGLLTRIVRCRVWPGHLISKSIYWPLTGELT